MARDANRPPVEAVDDTITRPFRDHGAVKDKRTRPCPACGATNSLTQTAVHLGNVCEDCLAAEGDVELD